MRAVLSEESRAEEGVPVRRLRLPQAPGHAPVAEEPEVPAPRPGPPRDAVAPAGAGRDRLQRAMTAGAGVLRTASSLAETSRVEEGLGPPEGGRAGWELTNLRTAARALLAAAGAREESRGAHSRADFPDTSPAWRCRLVMA